MEHTNNGNVDGTTITYEWMDEVPAQVRRAFNPTLSTPAASRAAQYIKDRQAQAHGWSKAR